MTDTPEPRKRKITGSDTVTVRLPNRVIRKWKRAARLAKLTRNGFVTRAVEEKADAVLSPAA